MTNLKDYIPPLVEAMKVVGSELLARRENNQVDGEWIGAQLKSSADIYAHEFLQKTLYKISPEIPFISEESIDLDVTERPDCYWLVDPIDGTASYVNGFDGFVMQVALIRDNVPQLAVIYAPATDECYTAIASEGAYKNNTRMTLYTNHDGVRLIDNYPEPRGIAKSIMEKLPNGTYVESGSLSLKALRVVEGGADLFVKDVVVRDWDFAAPIVIINELSACISQFNGKEFSLYGSWEKKGIIVCRDKSLHQQIIHLLAENETSP
ncbi:MAG: inositol monophosphatase [Gammaproteobacteria bacterium]|nr:inositol monophosphatase [Gammaproteobacteria bacterium]